MPTITVPLTAVSVLAAAPTRAFGQPAQVQVGARARVLMVGSLAQVPSNAMVSSAQVTMRHAAAWSGSNVVSIHAALGGWNTYTTWNTQPANGTAVDSVTRVNAAAGSSLVFNVTSLVQSWVSRAAGNYGFKVASTATVHGLLAGASASSGRPVLTVTYAVVAQPPTNLRPQGAAVSVAKPTLTADVGTGVSAIQVQVDPAANASSPAFDSGEVATTGGVLDLSTTNYAGLADGGSTQHRWRVKNALGWSDWSGWATFSRVAWKTLTVNSPGSTSEDPSPTANATYAGTATSWRVQFLSAAGVVVSDSQWQPGATISFTGTAPVGASGVARFQVRDNSARTATPGDPDFLQVDRAFTVSPSGTPATLTTFTAAKVTAASPVVRLSGSRAQIPDELVIYRNGVQIARVPGSQVFTGSGPYMFTWDDFTAPMNLQTVYSARAVSNGSFSNEATAAALTPTCQGIWLLDPDTGSGVAVWTGDDQDQAQPELAALSRPIGGTGAVVRRRLARAPREGSVSGALVDAIGTTAKGSESLLRTWVDPDTGYDAGHVFRLVLGGLNDPVIVGDLTLSEKPANTLGQRVLGVGFNWWWQG